MFDRSGCCYWLVDWFIKCCGFGGFSSTNQGYSDIGESINSEKKSKKFDKPKQKKSLASKALKTIDQHPIAFDVAYLALIISVQWLTDSLLVAIGSNKVDITRNSMLGGKDSISRNITLSGMDFEAENYLTIIDQFIALMKIWGANVARRSCNTALSWLFSGSGIVGYIGLRSAKEYVFYRGNFNSSLVPNTISDHPAEIKGYFDVYTGIGDKKHKLKKNWRYRTAMLIVSATKITVPLITMSAFVTAFNKSLNTTAEMCRAAADGNLITYKDELGGKIGEPHKLFYWQYGKGKTVIFEPRLTSLPVHFAQKLLWHCANESPDLVYPIAAALIALGLSQLVASAIEYFAFPNKTKLERMLNRPQQRDSEAIEIEEKEPEKESKKDSKDGVIEELKKQLAKLNQEIEKYKSEEPIIEKQPELSDEFKTRAASTPLEDIYWAFDTYRYTFTSDMIKLSYQVFNKWFEALELNDNAGDLNSFQTASLELIKLMDGLYNLAENEVIKMGTKHLQVKVNLYKSYGILAAVCEQLSLTGVTHILRALCSHFIKQHQGGWREEFNAFIKENDVKIEDGGLKGAFDTKVTNVANEMPRKESPSKLGVEPPVAKPKIYKISSFFNNLKPILSKSAEWLNAVGNFNSADVYFTVKQHSSFFVMNHGDKNLINKTDREAFVGLLVSTLANINDKGQLLEQWDNLWKHLMPNNYKELEKEKMEPEDGGDFQYEL